MFLITTILFLLAFWAFLAAALCTAKQREEVSFHWWCPLCHVCRIVAMVPQEAKKRA
jgi:hypothetical protein